MHWPPSHAASAYVCTLAYGIVKSLRLGGGKLKYFVFQQNGAGKKNQDIYRYIILL